MCKIRLIVKDNHGDVIHDELTEVSSDNVNVVDKHFYVICFSIESEIVLEYNFMNNNEEIDTLTDEDLEVKYGIISGRIFSFKLSQSNNLEDTTVFRLKNAILSRTVRTERFKSAFIQFIAISKILIANGKSYLI